MIWLTERQVAERLHCSPATVKRLRLTGKLPYIARRPVLIAEDDLVTYLASIRIEARNTPNPPGADRTSTPVSNADPAEVARRVWLARELRRRR